MKNLEINSDTNNCGGNSALFKKKYWVAQNGN
ncbi:MAG: hypothetical protein ACJAS3_001703 [Roseivirga sp.]|jgi:hypothetical protein